MGGGIHLGSAGVSTDAPDSTRSRSNLVQIVVKKQQLVIVL